jgi:hypothetical protein
MCNLHLVMFSNTKPRLQKETKGSYSSAVIGILVIATLIIFVAYLGVIAFEIFPVKSPNRVLDTNVDPLYSLEFNYAENSLEGVIKAKPDHNEPVDQIVYNPDKHYAEPGKIEWFNDSFSSDGEDLPICMDLDFGAKQWVVIRVLGGYTPTKTNYYGINAYGLMYLKDACGKIVFNDCVPGMFVGWVLNDYSVVECEGTMCDMCWVYYNFTLDPYACENWVCLDSSYDVDGNLQPCKYYTIEYDTHWKGCEFDKILAHVLTCPGILYSR